MKTRAIRRYFSIVEMMVALSVLAVIIYLSGQFVIRVQRLWETHRVNSNIYMNARVLLDVVTRDLQALAVEDKPGSSISYGNSGIGDLTFVGVTASGLGVQPDDIAVLSEFGYELDSDSQVIRYMSTSGAGPSVDWNFYNNAPSVYAATWADSTVLAEGVSEFSLTLFNSSLGLYTTSDTIVRPLCIQVHATLYNSLAVTYAMEERTSREYTKTIFLPQ